MKKFRITQKISAFLLREDGKISKKNILKVGVVLGAISLVAGTAEARCNHATNKPYGDCPEINPKLPSPYQNCNPESGSFPHVNSLHNNDLNVKNVFGKLVLGHGNCIETHQNHYNYVHGDGGGGDCGTCHWKCGMIVGKK